MFSSVLPCLYLTAIDTILYDNPHVCFYILCFFFCLTSGGSDAVLEDPGQGREARFCTGRRLFMCVGFTCFTIITFDERRAGRRVEMSFIWKYLFPFLFGEGDRRGRR